MPKQTKNPSRKPSHGEGASRPRKASSSKKAARAKSPAPKKANVNAGANTSTAGDARPWRPGREKFLPVIRTDMEARGWDQCDFVYICGDAYVDHPSFGMAIITRVLEAHGYRVGIICQPDWRDPASIQVLGEPRLGFLVSAGNMDSMVNHYSVTKHRRHTDAYTPGGVAGARPNHAVAVYGNLIRRVYKNTPLIIGGIEASLRRLAHYDYWSDKLKRSILLDSGADLLIYGMGEHAVVQIADALDAGLPVDQITYVDGTVYRTSGEGALDQVFDYELLPSWDELEAERLAYARSFNVQYRNMDPITAKRLVEPYPNGVYVVQNPPSTILTEAEMDEVYELPYARDWHPDYDAAGGVPAFSEVKFSISSNRGCFGECSFCALTFHQGRVLQTRSHDSIVREARELTRDPEFKGYINDVGGPTANFFRTACDKQLKHGVCQNRRCLWPTVCRNMVVDESGYTALLRDLRHLPGVKKVFVRSGIRFDYTMADASDEFLRELLQHHVSGQLRLAPEHVSDAVLSVMGKPSRSVYDAFCRRFDALNRECGLEQYVVPYLISSHPGSTMKEAVELACAVRDMGYMPEQVQDFYPTPSTMSTCMYYTGVDPRTMKPIYVAHDPHEKAMQRALIQYRKPENYKLVREALEKAGRQDLIGFDKKCLIKPYPPKASEFAGGKGASRGAGSRSGNGGASRSAGGRSGNGGASRGNGGRSGNGGASRGSGAGRAGGGRGAGRDGGNGGSASRGGGKGRSIRNGKGSSSKQ
ncbi:YgiQ family radical SAM protein [Collinsella tanakaei]|uniref:YgiQ family radical SAM protein n=1 Tax=Collinsella tanakaei TaxID=626935 RepID=UPI00248EDFE3|nr:YgiQ family radical SAM protein [Collinsella tanakaei]